MKNLLKNIKIDNYEYSILIENFSPLNKKITKNDRKCCCLMIKEKGKTTYNSNGFSYICDPNHIVFIPKGTDYNFIVNENGLCYQIDFTLIDNTLEMASFEISNPQILELFKQSIEAYNEDSTNITKQFSYIYQIFENIIKENESEDNYFSQAIKIIQRELANPKIDNILISKELNISEVYLRKIFNKTVKISPRKYIIKLRMEKAVNLLFNSYSINETARIIGYESVYSFSRAFKNYYNESPQKYIKRYD